MKLFGTFSGSGIFELAAQDAGIEVIGVCEIDEKCISLLKNKFPNAHLEKDIRNVTRQSFRGKPDIITGGFPCQDLSVAGNRKGLAGVRSGLYFEFQRIICEFEPSYVLIENVPGLLSSNKGRDFAVVLGGLTGYIPEVPRDGWRNSGIIKGRKYNVAWCVLDSQYFGVPQRRKRVFIVASLGNGRCAEILFEQESVYRNPPPSREKRENTTTDTPSGIRADSDTLSNKQSVFGGSGFGDYAEDRFSTLKTSGGDLSGGSESIIDDNGLMTNMDLPEAFGHSGGEALKINEIANSLTGQTGSETTAMIRGVVVPMTFEPGVMSREGGHAYKNISGTLGSNAGDNQMSVVAWEQSHRSEGYREAPKGISPTLQARMGTGGNNVPMVGVRRLTPLECERLQGMPDNWTEGFSDSTRYKMCGNAVTYNVVHWILKRIANVA